MNLNDLKKLMPEIFQKVKNDVRKVYRRHRAGLSLGLVEMGMFQQGFIGGMHFHPGTEIVMNKTPLKIILETQPSDIVWAYTYHILLHERSRNSEGYRWRYKRLLEEKRVLLFKAMHG